MSASTPSSRKPEDRPRERLEPLATLPAFFKLRGRTVLLAGAGAGTAWKAELLSAAGATTHLYAAFPSPELRDVVARPADGPILLHERPWRPADLRGALLAVGDFDEDDEARAFCAAARDAGVPVNCVDRPALCDFQFGSVVNRSPLVVGISTDGAAPVFGQAIRARIETQLPQGFKRWAEAARAWRPAVQARELPFRARRLFWERFTARALANPTLEPSDGERQSLFAGLEPSGDAGPSGRSGSVALIGAGPGDPELLTLKAVRYLQSADVVLFDDLIQRGVLDFARREARLVHVGKRGHKPSCTQEDINGMLVALAGEGLRVVRLKGGDPMIFGRAGEEIAALGAAGIPVEVIPGVTAASGAAASLQVSLTHRDAARRVQFVTSHARNAQLPEDLDWRALADPAATTAVYMGVKTLPEFVARVLAAGLSPATPVAVVERATWPDERILRGRLDTIADVVAAARPRGPCLVLIGEAIGIQPAALPAGHGS
ncbi:siroheme synthase CysG [Chelatococcus reniformis]|uniref:Siroheme synthase n=1 Tax=Chelatococcus reniformis TaxID=1494448 RepID=A0A916UII9_9HYPH|nr:siroheme synthase CysG [Chelatococcus reniformis]GGC73447.1 siroheme synthase [Chelatococcus reniformis]